MKVWVDGAGALLEGQKAKSCVVFEDGDVKVFDLQGRRVRTLLRGWQVARAGHARWDGLRDDGRPAVDGTYFVRLGTAEGVGLVQKVVLAR